MEKLNTEYNGTAEELSLLEIELHEATKKLDEAKKALEEADLKLNKLEEIRLQLEHLKQKETEALANLKNAEDSSKSLAEKIESKKNGIENLNQRLGSMETQMKSYKEELKAIGISPDQPMESIKDCLGISEDQISSLKGQQEAAAKGTRDDEKRISALSTENRCPLCLQSISEDYKNSLVQRLQDENNERQRAINQLRDDINLLQQKRSKADVAFSNLQTVIVRIGDLKTRINDESQALNETSQELENKQRLEKELQEQLETLRVEISKLDVSELEVAKTERNEAQTHFYAIQSELRVKEDSKKYLAKRLDETKERIDQAQHKIERMQKIVKIVEIMSGIREAYRSIQPKLRSEFMKVLRNFVQQVLDTLVGGEGSLLDVLIDETYTPYVKSESGVEREVSNLSGGERTLLAFAYRLGLGQLIMQSRTGHGLSMLLLDEPTESLGSEDGSIERLAESISRLKAIEQIIAVTHSEAFADKAEHVIRLEKEAGVSRVSVEK
jgi:exonuclease SbcC